MSKIIVLLCLVALAITLKIDEHQADYLDAGKYTLQDPTGKYLVDACPIAKKMRNIWFCFRLLTTLNDIKTSQLFGLLLSRTGK